MKIILLVFLCLASCSHQNNTLSAGETLKDVMTKMEGYGYVIRPLSWLAPAHDDGSVSTYYGYEFKDGSKCVLQFSGNFENGKMVGDHILLGILISNDNEAQEFRELSVPVKSIIIPE
ncbi:MAG: hypothetical protein NE327_15085 [Lentisphaeraceae bacterium]|nr:hypothetical protein [Lentisphaeraceae bacterium]